MLHAPARLRLSKNPAAEALLRRGSFMLKNGKSLDFKRFSGIEKAHRNSIKITVDFWQRMRDSNPHKRSQSPVCYLYTNPLLGSLSL